MAIHSFRDRILGFPFHLGGKIPGFPFGHKSCNELQPFPEAHRKQRGLGYPECQGKSLGGLRMPHPVGRIPKPFRLHTCPALLQGQNFSVLISPQQTLGVKVSQDLSGPGQGGCQGGMRSLLSPPLLSLLPQEIQGAPCVPQKSCCKPQHPLW